MRKLLVLLTLLLTLSIRGVAGNYENLQGEFTDRIQSVYIYIPSRVLIYLSDDSRVRIKGDMDVIKYITYQVRNGNLIIKSVPGMEDLLKDRPITVYISTNVDRVEVISSRNYSINRKTKSGNHVKK